MVGGQEVRHKESFLVSYLSFFIPLSYLSLLFLTPGRTLLQVGCLMSWAVLLLRYSTYNQQKTKIHHIERALEIQ